MKKLVANREYLMGDSTVKILRRTPKRIIIGMPDGDVVWAYTKDVDGVETAMLKGKRLFDADDTAKGKAEPSEVYAIVKTTNWHELETQEGTFESLREYFGEYLKIYKGVKGISQRPRTIESLVLNLNKMALLETESTVAFIQNSYKLEQSVG